MPDFRCSRGYDEVAIVLNNVGENDVFLPKNNKTAVQKHP
jgi:hypothetical protein